MTLSEIYKTIDYTDCRNPVVRKILNSIVLIDFHRDKKGKVQTFYFRFIYKEKKYTLEHSFLYHGTGVDNSFKFRKPFLSLNPFSLNKGELLILSGELMKAVNQWS